MIILTHLLRTILLWLLLVAVAPETCTAFERVRFADSDKRRSVDGEILVEAMDGGILLLGQDGRIWTLPPDDIIERESYSEPFQPLDRKQLTAELKKQLPAGFEVHRTAHYLVFFNTSRAYAQWCGSLYERLYRAFYNFWKWRGFELATPQTPLVAIVFDNAEQYRAFSETELGEGAPPSVIGFYSLRTNWITTYDLTGIEGIRRPGSRAKTSVVVNQILSQPAAEPNVATLIHEATHQIAFNSGLQTRYADNPLWLSEGLAVFFEVPDLSSTKGWRGIGNVHPTRLAKFHETRGARRPGLLKTLVTSDQRLRDPENAVTAYAESWALCYYLIKRREKDFVAYLKALAEQPRLVFGTPEDRYALFSEHFGDVRDLESKFTAYMRSLR